MKRMSFQHSPVQRCCPLTWLWLASSVKDFQETNVTCWSRFSETWRHQYYFQLNFFMLSFVLKPSGQEVLCCFQRETSHHKPVGQHTSWREEPPQSLSHCLLITHWLCLHTCFQGCNIGLKSRGFGGLMIKMAIMLSLIILPFTQNPAEHHML